MDSESKGLIQALHAFNNQFASFILASQQDRVRSQKHLDLSAEWNIELESQMAELTKEVSLLKRQINEMEATRKDELEVVRSLKQELEATKNIWDAEVAEGKLRYEVERKRVFLLARKLEGAPAEIDSSQALPSAKIQQVLTRFGMPYRVAEIPLSDYHVASFRRTHMASSGIPSPVETPILNQPANHRSQRQKSEKNIRMNEAVTLQVYIAAPTKACPAGDYTPILTLRRDAVLENCLATLILSLARQGATDYRIWRIPAALVSQHGWYFPISNIGREGVTIDITNTSRSVQWKDGDAVVIEPRLFEGWLTSTARAFTPPLPPPREIDPRAS